MSDHLRELLSASQQALQAGQGYYGQAHHSHEICQSYCGKLDSAHTKLEVVSRELNKQLQLISQLVAQLRGRNVYLMSSLEALRNSDEQILRALSDVFRKLSEKTVEANIAPNKTLFDYVDTDSVEGLKAQALQEMQELKNIQDHSHRILQTIESNYERLVQNTKEATVTVDYRPAFATERLSQQMSEISAMSSILSAISSQHDRINQLYSPRDNNRSIHDPSFLDRADSELTALVTRMFETLQRIQAITTDVDNRTQRYGVAFKNSVKLLTALETFGLEAKNRLMELGNLETSFEERKEGAKFVFEELSNLVTWYDLFYTAYIELLFEIDRRHKEQKRQQELLESYQRELDALWKGETEKRDTFFEFYGRYLPQSLCPVIMEPAAQHRIIPDRIPSELPLLHGMNGHNNNNHLLNSNNGDSKLSHSPLHISLSELSDETLENLVLSPSLSRTPRGTLISNTNNTHNSSNLT